MFRVAHDYFPKPGSFQVQTFSSLIFQYSSFQVQDQYAKSRIFGLSNLSQVEIFGFEFVSGALIFKEPLGVRISCAQVQISISQFQYRTFNIALSIPQFQYRNFKFTLSIPHLYLPSPFLGNVDLLLSPFLGGLVFTNSALYLVLWCCFMCFIAFITNMLNTTKYKGYITLNKDIFGQTGLRFLKSIFKAKWPPYN